MGHSRWQQFNRLVLHLVGWLSIFTLGDSPVLAQILSTGATTITTNGAQIQVTGGGQSIDGANLFHRFETFHILPDQTVTFIAPEPVENVLGQITGREASIIDGGLAVSNGANLWLLNPAGLFFGPNAQLNLQGDFTAATADAIGFDQGWFIDGADYQALVGHPQGFAFISNPGHLINLGNLAVAPGHHLRLLGGSVINGGHLSAPDGNITLAAVANGNRINLSQTGQILALEIEPWSGQETSFNITQLPALLTGQGVDHADTLAIAADGTLQLAQQLPTLPSAPGEAHISGTVQTTGDYGGQIAILGNQVSLIEADIKADGLYQGGYIAVGGSYQGAGSLPNATHTQVDQNTQLSANALADGNGGEIIIWADQATSFSGDVQAQGGRLGGNGGFIEISGKSQLGFTGQFSVSAPQGEFGSILFDPDNIQVVDGNGTANGDIEFLIDRPDKLPGTVVAADGDNGWFTINEGTLEGWDGDANVVLQANNDIFIQNLGGDNALTFQAGTGTISFIADADDNGTGDFRVAKPGDLIDTAGRDITISGANINLELLDTRSNTGATGDVSLIAQNLIRVQGTLNADDITIQGDAITLNGGNDSVRGNTLSLRPGSPGQTIEVGSNAISSALNLLETDILAINDGFSSISIGRADGTGNVILYDAVANGGSAPFKDPVTILGANTLQGPEQVTTWTITGNNQGNLNSLFSHGLTFENVMSIAASNNTSDTLQGTGDNDTVTLTSNNAGTFKGIDFTGIHNIRGEGGDDSFIFANGVASVSGSIDGGGGNNSLDLSNYVIDIVLNLDTNNISGTGGFSNIQQVIGGFGSNTIQGTAGNDVITLTGDGIGTINNIAFQAFRTVTPGDGDDRFLINGDTSTSLDGGPGVDILDYSANTAGVTLDLATQTADNGVVFNNIENFRGSRGEDTLRGTNADDEIAITADNSGTLGPTTLFSGIENIDTGAGNDQIAIAPNGNLSGTLAGGSGTDSLDYSTYTTNVTINLADHTATALGGFTNIEQILGGSGNNDSISGTHGNDNIILNGVNSGTINTLIFNNVEHILGQAGDDSFIFDDGASITGTLTGGDGIDTVNYSSYTTGITVDLQTHSATGTGGVSTLDSFIGGSHNDTFRLRETNAIGTIDGGTGSDTLEADQAAAGVWNLTDANAGNGTGVSNFSNIENLIAGNQADQVNFLADGARFTETLDGGDGLLTLSGDTIDIGTLVKGSDELVLQPFSADKDIQLGGTDLTSTLTISTADISNISPDFTGITIGHAAGANAITLGADITFLAPATIQTPNGDGSINTQGFNLSAPKLTLIAAQDITTANLTAENGVTLNSGDAINTQAILTFNTFDGGNVVINANQITTQQINTIGTTNNGGNVTLTAATDIEVESIRAEGHTAGGHVDITSNGFFRATDSFTALDGTTASISTAAVTGTGTIMIRHAGNGSTPFKVGDGNRLGSHAALTSGDVQIDIGNSFLNSYTLGNIAVLTQDIGTLAMVESPVVTPPNILLPLSINTSDTLAFNPPLLEDRAFADDSLSESLQVVDSNKALFEQLENTYSDQFKSHLNLYERVSVSSISLATAQQTLENVEASIGVKPGVLYVYFLPPANNNKALTSTHGFNLDDELGLLLITHNGQTIRKKVEGVTRRDVMAVAEEFSAQVTNSISLPSQYLPPAQQLYRWFITPVEDDLQQQGVQSLALAMDTGLRTLPMAALHSGEEFLVERYSVGVIPSFSLTDFNSQNFLYTQLEGTKLLAMGASQFQSQQLLPAVPKELKIVTQAFHDSEVFLNERFTLNNLQTQVARNQFGIVHLASHGVFKPGEPRNSYIQLWDQPLQLDQVHSLGLQEADIALMVLSACNTALGDREAEYGFAGLAVNAGVQTSVASLWPISDEGTLGLMTYFYESLRQQPVRANALRQAQLAMLQGDLQFAEGTLYGAGDEPLAHFPELEYHGRWNFEHPFYWSTYTLVGSPW